MASQVWACHPAGQWPSRRPQRNAKSLDFKEKTEMQKEDFEDIKEDFNVFFEEFAKAKDFKRTPGNASRTVPLCLHGFALVIGAASTTSLRQFFPQQVPAHAPHSALRFIRGSPTDS